MIEKMQKRLNKKMALYNNKYRIETARLKTWDYQNAAAYFVTVCTGNRTHFFGRIENGNMILNNLGLIVQEEWMKTPGIRPDMNLLLDEFVVMPNHFHGIIFIGDNKYNTPVDGNDAMRDDGAMRDDDAMYCVSTMTEPTGHNPIKPKPSGNIFGPQSKNLGSIMRGIKSAVKTKASKIIMDFRWQERYHDHIIRNQESFIRIQQYIINNPQNWKDDKFFTS